MLLPRRIKLGLIGASVLALGAEIPRNVELFAFPEEGLACAPELAGYRYIVVEDDVGIVDPVDYAISGVITR